MGYEVVVLGILPGFNETEVKAAFADLFSLTAEKVESIFAAEKTVLKTGISETLGKKYITKLSEIGVYAESLPVSSVELEAESADTAHNEPPRPDETEQANATNNQARHVPFVFSGNGFEYFKIWIVNVLLSVITLGIYSAWAKVRNKQYFYGNTTLDGASFSYTANPVKILIGRVIATVFFILYSVAGEFSVALGIIMALLMLVFMPWIICRSLHFNARYSSYRNISFSFNGSVKEAFMVFIVWPLLGVITIGILFPLAYHKQQTFMFNHHAYGTEPFSFSATVGAYYKIFLITLGIAIAAGMFSAAAFAMGSAVLAVLMYSLLYLLFFAYFIVGVNNLRYNSLALQDHTFAANWKLKSYALLLVTNTLGIVFTLGFFIPWARVRTARYKAKHLQCVIVGNIDNFIANEAENVNALGESVGDIFDIDIGF